MKSITVLQGYHYGDLEIKNKKNRSGNQFLKSYINTRKPYNFKVTNDTKRPKSARLGRIASVDTKRGASKIVITKIIHAKGSMAIKMASKLRPVTSISYFGMRNGFLYKILNSKTGLNIKKPTAAEKRAKKRRAKNK